MNSLSRIAEILSEPAEVIDSPARWRELDELIFQVPEGDRHAPWESVRKRMESSGRSQGHPLFRLAMLALLRETSEHHGLAYLEQAYQEDKKFAPEKAHRMAAYRVLALIKDYFAYLGSKSGNWEAQQFSGADRRQQMEILLAAYDYSLMHPIDQAKLTHKTFEAIIKDRDLYRFACQNYFCVEEFFLSSGRYEQLLHIHEYPWARALVGMLGGVLECIVMDLSSVRGKPLGATIQSAYDSGKIPKGSRLAALCSLILFLRNHVHPDRDVKRDLYFVDMTVAHGCKAALDLTIAELARSTRVP